MPSLIGLNLGCGPKVFPSTTKVEWFNIDRVDMASYIGYLVSAPDNWSEAGMKRMPLEQRKLSMKVKAGAPVTFLQHDVRERLPFADGSVDIIMAGQLIEHFTPHEAEGFLRECRRVLKEGGLMRLSTPDLDKLFSTYNEGKMALFDQDQPQKYWEARSQAMKLGYMLFGSLGEQPEYRGHKMVYNLDSLTEILKVAGFKDVVPMKEGKSQAPLLKKDLTGEGHGSHSLFVEVVKK